MEELWDDYFQYLIWRCGLQRMTKLTDVFAILHNIPFTYILERDDNREEDGCDLRNEYNIPSEFSVEMEEAFFAHWCSVFEMLIGLAIRVDDEFIGDPADEHPEDFFIEMLENLGLTKFVGRRYREQDVIKIVQRWLDRQFDKDGRGSPFPVHHDHRDQRKIEIWDQMNSYISENYD